MPTGFGFGFYPRLTAKSDIWFNQRAMALN